MKTIEIIKSKNGYKIINRSPNKHPLLILLAELLCQSNKSNSVKVGLYNVFGQEFSMRISVYSYIADKIERMSKQQYYKFLKGERSVRSKNGLDIMIEKSQNIDLGLDINKVMEAINA